MSTPAPTLVQPDAKGFLPNGWIDSYPHNDFDRPCTGPCCEPTAYANPYPWECQNPECSQVNGSTAPAKIYQPGECVNCCPLATPSAN